MPNEKLKKVIQNLQNWGGQTVMFTMNMRALEIGKMQDNVDFLESMRKEAEETTKELWTKALSECSKPLKSGELLHIFVTKILDWCAKHRET